MFIDDHGNYLYSIDSSYNDNMYIVLDIEVIENDQILIMSILNQRIIFKDIKSKNFLKKLKTKGDVYLMKDLQNSKQLLTINLEN